jgi:HD-GYP domain-containing protein (c-di-GMP phosphodiesterase class II)
VSAYELRYPVHTVDGIQVFPAGSLVTPEALDEAVAANRSAQTELAAFLAHGSIEKDLVRLIDLLPYRVVFGSRKRTATLFELMKNVRLPVAVFGMLDYFREHDPYTYRHVLLVFSLATLLAQDLLPDQQDQSQEAIAGPVHDLGKICTPLSILKKTTPLTETKRMAVEHHAISGYILVAITFGNKDIPAARIARDHHERRDSSGYPAGIRIRDKMTEIVIVSDLFDALVSPRPYRSGSFDNRTALEEITLLAEKGALGWEVTRALVALNRKGQPHYGDLNLSLEKRGSPPAINYYGKTET